MDPLFRQHILGLTGGACLVMGMIAIRFGVGLGPTMGWVTSALSGALIIGAAVLRYRGDGQ